MTSAAQVSKRYATALVDLAEEGKAISKIEKDMVALASLMQGSEVFASFISSPTISVPKQHAAVGDFVKKMKLLQVTANFLGVIIDNGRLDALPHIVEAVLSELAARRGEMVVQVQSANVLSAAQQKALKKELDEATGKSVMLEASVDEDLLGGMIVTVGSKRIDSSIAGRLDRLKIEMSKRVVLETNDNDDIKEKKEA